MCLKENKVLACLVWGWLGFLFVFGWLWGFVLFVCGGFVYFFFNFFLVD